MANLTKIALVGFCLSKGIYLPGLQDLKGGLCEFDIRQLAWPIWIPTDFVILGE
jgi:hypothetical protein